MLSYMICFQFLSSAIKWKMGGTEVCKIRSHTPHYLAFICLVDEADAVTKKATLGGPSSDETLPFREKIKF